MALNVGWVKLKKYKENVEDAAEKKACGNTSLKVIIETMVCKDEQMVNACKCVIGAQRFGIGLPCSINIIEDAMKLPGGAIDLSTVEVKDAENLHKPAQYKKNK